MSIFLINATNLKNGGGLQVAQSVCSEVKKYPQHKFLLVLSEYVNNEGLCNICNARIIKYNIKNDWRTLLLGRDRFLDGIVERDQVDAVLTIFGPSRWRPRVPHLCGFARAQLLKDVNPSLKVNSKKKLVYKLWTWAFRRSSDIFYTENPYISGMLPNLLKHSKVYTVSNYYNQVFDQPERWRRDILLPEFNGTTLLTISSTAAHKNLGIMVPVAEYLEQKYPDFHFRFVLTCKKAPFELPERLRHHFVFVGKVDVSECPNLYEQADIMFMPTLLECFTATYPEAMRMEVPIVTTDLEFAHGLCGDAACYYSAVDAKAAAEAIYKVTNDKEYTYHLIANGKKQLLTYDNYEQRAEKLIHILEELVKV